MAIKGTRILKAPQLKVKRKKVGSSTQRVSKDALGRTRLSRFMKADGDGKVRQQKISIVRPKRPPTKAVPKRPPKNPRPDKTRPAPKIQNPRPDKTKPAPNPILRPLLKRRRQLSGRKKR